ncbi:hypothetical protein B0H19DRAFT_1083961 [Mycena capillaripes]|nr:hypothetical protein B0H19DRAFT_1083961 [Mycena capillaripes]
MPVSKLLDVLTKNDIIACLNYMMSGYRPNSRSANVAIDSKTTVAPDVLKSFRFSATSVLMEKVVLTQTTSLWLRTAASKDLKYATRKAYWKAAVLWRQSTLERRSQTTRSKEDDSGRSIQLQEAKPRTTYREAVEEEVNGLLGQRQGLYRCCHHQYREAVEEEVNGLLSQRQGLYRCCHHQYRELEWGIMPVMQRIRMDHAGDAEDHRERRQQRKGNVNTTEASVISCTSQKCAVVTKGPAVRSNDWRVMEGVQGHGGRRRLTITRGRSHVPE